MNRFIVLTTCCFLAVVGAACSGTDAVDKQGYIKENNKIQEKINSEITALNPQDPKDIETAIKAMDTAIEDFEALEVPADYEKPHAKLIDSVKEIRSVMVDLKSVGNDAAKGQKLLDRMNAAQSDYTSAINEMNADLA